MLLHVSLHSRSREGRERRETETKSRPNGDGSEPDEAEEEDPLTGVVIQTTASAGHADAASAAAARGWRPGPTALARLGALALVAVTWLVMRRPRSAR